MTTADHYLPKPIYDELVDRLGAIQPDRFTGKIERHQIVELLGEIGGIWPATVLDDPAGEFAFGRPNLKIAS